jgi:hypothetical protein
MVASTTERGKHAVRRAAMVEPFLARISAASTTAQLEDAFPFRILETRGRVADFVEFYRGI